jgi:hypothetical protein
MSLELKHNENDTNIKIESVRKSREADKQNAERQRLLTMGRPCGE